MTEGSPRACLFCGRRPPEVKISNEHVLRKWLKTQLREPLDPTRRQWDVIGGPPGVARSRDSGVIPESSFDYRINDVCTSCNAGWMREREEAVEHVLVPLMRGEEDLELAAADCLALSNWAAKTAVVRARTAMQPLAVPADIRRSFPTASTPPASFQVWAGRLLGHSGGASRHASAQFEPAHYPLMEEGKFAGFKTVEQSCHATLIGIDRVMFLVLGVHTLLPADSIFAPHTGSRPAWHRLWPGPESLQWPPPTPLTWRVAHSVLETAVRSLVA